MAIVWINGMFVEEAEASVSVRDTGLLHAAGVFTTLRANSGRVFRLDQHLERIRTSCEALFIPMLPKDDVLRDAIGELLTRNDLTDARLRLTVTRGMGRPAATRSRRRSGPGRPPSGPARSP